MKPADIDFYMDMAERAALRSKATRLKVGAILVNPDDVLAMGYNGTPKGWDNTCEENGITKPEVIHAEMNGLNKFLKNGVSTKGAAIFITHAPCIECAKAIFLADLSELYYRHEYRCTSGLEFLRKAGIRVQQLT